MASLQGVRNVVDQLTLLQGEISHRAAKAGVNAALGVLNRAIKDGVNASGMSLEAKAAARATVNKRLLRKEGDDTAGKAGFGVGKQSAAKKRKAHARYVRGQGGNGEERGTGISAKNVHWLLGTADRSTGARTVKDKVFGGTRKVATGNAEHHTGAMPDILGGIIAAAVDACEGEMAQAMSDKIQQVLEKEAKK